ncbi:hypothetical protein C7293_18660 [filamentous cyanobacterium CCT1]|nr:hypothetical protein C7293_18660 [filamentous cyanobacterium CCT1]PSN76874.1 hypothetical protein C8B47_25030 [filamentous cyanobacterium CCP4]
MNSKAQSALTILATGAVFSMAGLWIAPQSFKPAVVGALAGATGAVAYTQQNKRLRQLAAQQQQLLSRGHTKTTPERVARITASHGDKITEIERNLHSQAGQSKLSQNEINRIRKRLEVLESQVKDSRTGTTPQSLAIKLEALEDQIQLLTVSRPTQQTKLPINSEAEDNLGQGNRLLIDLEPDDLSSEDEAAQTIIQWFNRRGIDVQNYYEPDDRVDDLLDGLSLYLGDHYSTLSQFHWRLRNSLGRRAYISLDDFNPSGKSIHNQFLKKLRSCDYLSFGKIIKGKDGHDYILAAPYTRSDVQGFLDGGWFERFVYYKIVELLNSEGVEYQHLRNLKITYQDGQNAELDLFFLINDIPLLVECKAGQDFDMRQVDGYRDRLNLEASQALLVSLNIDDAEAHLRSINWKLGVANQNTFLDHIREIIPTDIDSQLQQSLEDFVVEIDAPPPQSAELNHATDDDLVSFFQRRGLNQAAEARESILLALIQFFEGDHEPTKFNDLTKILRDRTAIGRNKIVEALNCLRYSDIFRDKSNRPIRRNTSQPIYGMASTKLKTLERKCIEFYADKVVQLFDPDFFKAEDNCHEFERLTQGELPMKYKPTLDA